MARDVNVNIDIKTRQATENLAAVKNTTDKTRGSMNALDASLNKLPGPLKNVQQGVRGLGKSFKALLANPIVALIAALAAALVGLFAAFKKTQAGADAVGNVMSAISATIDVVIGRAAKLAQAIGKLFRGDFRGAAEAARDAVSGVGDEIREATAAAIEFEEAQRRLFESETDLLEVNAERRKQIAELVFATRDQTKSVEERRDAIVRSAELEAEILEDNLRLQRERVRLAELELANTPENLRTREQERKIAEENAKLLDLETQSITRQRELKNRLNELDREALRIQAEKQRAEEERQKELEEQRQAAEAEAQRLRDQELAAEQALIDSLENYRRQQRARTYEGQLENLRRALEAGEILEEEYRLRRADLENAEAERQRELDEREAERKRKLLEQEDAERQAAADAEQRRQEELAAATLAVREGIYQDSLTALLGFLDKESKAAKALQIADATRTAIQGAVNAYTATLKLGAPIGTILAPIAAAAALAAGMANVRKMAQTGDEGGGSVGVPSVSLAAPTSNIATEIVNPAQGVPGEVSIIQDQTVQGRTFKTFVVQSEVTAEQEIAKKAENDATL